MPVSPLPRLRTSLLLALILLVPGPLARAHPQDGPHADLRAAIEPDGVRWSVGVNIAFLDEVLGVHREALDRVEPVEAERLREEFEAYLREQVRVTIDGRSVEPTLENVRLDLTPDAAMVVLYPRTGMRALMRCSAVIVYPADDPPEHVELTWPGYPVDQLAAELEPENEVRMVLEGQVRAEGVVELVRFSEADPTVEWSAGGIASRFLQVPPVPEGEGEPTRVSVVSLAMAGVAGMSVLWLGVALSRGRGGARALVTLGVSAVLGLATMGVTRVEAPWLGRAPTPIDRVTLERVFRVLHQNMYRSFDYTDESDVYDALAGSVEGPLLEELYTQIYGSLVQAEQGGMLGIITGIDPLELAIDNIRRGAWNGEAVLMFDATHRWRVDG
ncbi:MAG: hypothetical protein ACIARR_04005, partial [Phycisphaerales bacterium JB059]